MIILGTMPGEMSLKLNQYYGHGSNHFWKLIYTIFNEPYSTVYENRKNVLLKNNIALWDVLKACIREGSADNAIVNEEANDFETFFSTHPNITLIAFNGKSAAAYFNKYCTIKPEIKTITIPSTSSANTWKKFEEKLIEWRKIKII